MKGNTYSTRSSLKLSKFTLAFIEFLNKSQEKHRGNDAFLGSRGHLGDYFD